METLDSDLEQYAGNLRAKYIQQDKQRLGKHKDYRSYYNDFLVDLVHQTWERELKLFGYNFEGLNLDKAIIKKEVTKDIKKSLKYNWTDDILLINGKKFNA